MIVLYFVDRELMETRIVYLESLIKELEKSETPSTLFSKMATERMCHMIIETVMDIGNQMIDGFIMRDPGSYEDILHIMVDEKVLLKIEGDALTSLIPWRKDLLQQYTQLNDKDLYDAFQSQMEALKTFPLKVRSYLKTELGPVSAFLPEK
ncbi:DUF86 domain-containing protein [Salipaludibacillus sp. CF4.18]|uniref:DUF86 domain-containing protein n=1 Tax=Salipaludibacillus sp. CF4.18 TaxID=3373081 RepID=UPI003EE7537E